ncbi:hypothetical protein DM860_011288 [Cuscuta australis]|uniref:Uncharacterized protein n=1 Tax=Cuscuta australis TaxID=267555 RepID=A0A328DQK4_9ASTE|nr:hypothetical protein DM860_011288 [Cuscuta australis]
MALSSKASKTKTTIFRALTLLILIVYCPKQPSAALSAAPKPFKRFYAFGDSITDTGNTNSTTGPIFFTHVSNPPYGRTFFHRPTNRYSDGRIVIDFVAGALSLPLLPPYLDPAADRSHGVNFAVAGCTAINHRFYVRNNITLNITPQSLGTQWGWFNRHLKTLGCPKDKDTPNNNGEFCRAVFEDSLFWLGPIGVNDYSYIFGSSITSHTIQRLSISSISSFLQALLNKGAKYVVVQGLPMLGCTSFNLYLADPGNRDGTGCVATVNNQSAAHNTALRSLLNGFSKRYPNATLVYADCWSAYEAILTHRESYGITEPFKACCGSGGGELNFDLFDTCGSSGVSCPDPSKYINWDGGHLTEAMYKAVADKLINGTFCDPPFSYLIKKKMSSSSSA